MNSEVHTSFLDFSTIIKKNEKEFKFTLTQEFGKLIIKIDNLSSLPIINYENEFTKSQLDKISKYFRLFDDVSELIPELFQKIKDNDFSLIDNKTNIILSFESKIKVVNNYSLIINNKENKNNESINEILNNVLKDNEYLKNEIKEQKEEILKLKNEIKEIKNITKVNKVNELPNNMMDSKILTKNEDIQLISNWIKPNNKKTFNLLYRASKDGDRISTFTSKVSGKSPTLIIIKSTSGFKFGGYTAEQWDMTGSYNYKSDSNSFIFSIDKRKKYNLKNRSYSICGDLKELEVFEIDFE